jgi:outer membrane protein OmpA-like peptidoglycan-associated protein
MTLIVKKKAYCFVITFFFLLNNHISFAQANATDSDSINLIFYALDTNSKSLMNEKVILKSFDNTFEYIGLTDAEGSFKTILKKGQPYKIYCRNSASELDYIELLIPNDSGDIDIEYTLVIEPKKEFLIQNLYFDFGKALLTDVTKFQLNEIAEWMIKNPAIQLEILGFLDSIEFLNNTNALDLMRANSVQDYFIQKGINKTQLAAKAMGITLQLAFNSTEKDRAKNRRVEFKITKN